MKLNETITTYICQLNKPENRAMLEGYKARKNKSGEELACYYKDVIEALKHTPAWGISGVNKMVNELTVAVRATLNKEKKGKTSAYAHASKLLRTIDFYGNEKAISRYNGNYKLKPLLTDSELSELATMRG